MPLVDQLMKMRPVTAVTGSLWDGPDGDTENSGVTQSLISRWLQCRERSRVFLVEGWKPIEQWNHRLGYGTMWHLMEESLAQHQGKFGPDAVLFAEQQLLDRATELCRKFPMQQQEISKWWNVCKVQFPIYVRHWSCHPDVTDRKPLLSEHEFSVPYTLPSGRKVRLRGKWDSVDLVGGGTCPCCEGTGIASGRGWDAPAALVGASCSRCGGKGTTSDRGVFLQENKTKGDVDEVEINRQLRWDLQTMFYLTALWLYRDVDGGVEDFGSIRGVRYNVVRRPLSGGKGSIVQYKDKPPVICLACKGSRRTPKGTKECGRCKGRGVMPGMPGESDAAYHARLARVIQDDPGSFFMRWSVTVTPEDVARFRRQTLDPILEQLWDWWEWVGNNKNPWREGNGVHWRMPYGAGGSEYWNADVDAYIDNGSTAGLERATVVFPELNGGG